MHLVPEKFDLHVHAPLDVHDVDEAPELLQPQAVKVWKKQVAIYTIYFLIFFLTVAIRIFIKPCLAGGALGSFKVCLASAHTT